jgi:hypothetical protein
MGKSEEASEDPKNGNRELSIALARVCEVL